MQIFWKGRETNLIGIQMANCFEQRSNLSSTPVHDHMWWSNIIHARTIECRPNFYGSAFDQYVHKKVNKKINTVASAIQSN